MWGLNPEHFQVNGKILIVFTGDWVRILRDFKDWEKDKLFIILIRFLLSVSEIT